MAESFLCRGEWIDWSNGATEALFECWAAMAAAAPDQPGMAAVAAYLRWSLDSSGPGNRAFGMDREVIPDTLAGPAEIAALLEVIQRTADDPCRMRSAPKLTTDGAQPTRGTPTGFHTRV